ncbi:protein kinase-like domain, concanavalin A-like lectin/glucanase domain protein [Tanacetum coccineum]
MYRLYYYWIMNEKLESRKKPSNPSKTCNFVGRVRGLKVFVGSFTYECDFMVLEDVNSVIDCYLGEMILGKPFVKQYKLTYDKEEGTVMFEKNDERITFKMPHKMEIFKDIFEPTQTISLENNQPLESCLYYTTTISTRDDDTKLAPFTCGKSIWRLQNQATTLEGVAAISQAISLAEQDLKKESQEFTVEKVTQSIYVQVIQAP